MERVTIFLDLANLEQGFRKLGVQVDYLGLRDYLADGRVLVETFAYLPINPYTPDRKKHFADFLQRNGFLVRSKIGKPRPGNRWKCNFDVEIAVDVLHCAHHGRVDIVVIASGDGDMLRLCDEVRLLGVRCEIAATRESTAEELIRAASGYVDLGAIVREQCEEVMGNSSEDANRTVSDTEEPNLVS
jgi:uncharacterized LabA/DUF88 family protein